VYIARQRLSKNVTPATNTHNNRRIVGRVVFYAVSVVSKECLWVCLCIPLIIARKRFGKRFPAATGIVAGVVFYAARVVSKKRRQLVLRRTSCIYDYVSHVVSSIPIPLLNILFIYHLLYMPPILSSPLICSPKLRKLAKGGIFLMFIRGAPS
jgi:hypothetical protein